jgi:hypothetical protein
VVVEDGGFVEDEGARVVVETLVVVDEEAGGACVVDEDGTGELSHVPDSGLHPSAQ